MNKISRRNLARYGAAQLLTGTSAGRLAKQLVSVLNDDKRIAEVEQLLADIDYELESCGKLATAEVTTAHDLSTKLRSEINHLIKQSTKVEAVELDETIDKKVIGGIRLQTATRVWDKTVARQLNQIREIA